MNSAPENMSKVGNTNRDRRRRALIITSILFCVLQGILYYVEPPFDGDSFEYAGVARNLVRYGEMREDLLRSFAVPGQALPHPSAERANLYVYFLAPFYAIFRDTHWTFTIPALIGLFLLPLVVYRVGGALFGANAGFFAAVLSLFCPSLLRLYTLMDPGLPEVWQMIFYLLFISALMNGKYAVSGLLMAAAFLFKKNGMILIPASVMWLFIYRRKSLFGAPALKMFGVALLMVMPFLTRSWIVFGSPFYNEQFTGISRLYDGTMIEHFESGRMFGMIFNYEAYNGPGAEHGPEGGAYALNFLRTVGINVRMMITGMKTDVFYIPGVLQAVGLLLLPFGIFGAWKSRGSPAAPLMILIFLAQLAMHAIMGPYSDRYILSVIPPAMILGAVGIEHFAVKISGLLSGINPRRLAVGIVVFVLLSDSAGFFIMNFLRFARNPHENLYTEMNTACDYLQARTAPDAVIMTYPFFSTHFICDRPTVPFPYGDISTAATVVDRFGVDYIFFTEVWPGDFMPDPPFATPEVRGMQLSVFKTDVVESAPQPAGYEKHYLDALNPVEYFLVGRADFEVSPPLYKLLSGRARSVFIGIPIYLAVFIFFISLVSFRARAFRTFLLVVIAVAMLGFQVFHLVSVFKPFQEPRPMISRVETEMLVKNTPGMSQMKLFVIDNFEGAKDMEKDLKSYFGDVAMAQDLPEVIEPRAAFFVPVPVQRTWLTDEFALTAETAKCRSRQDAVRQIELIFNSRGLKALPVYGGVFGYPPTSSD